MTHASLTADGLGPTARVAEFAVAADPFREASGVLPAARRALIDTIGCAIAGTGEPAARLVQNYVLEAAVANGCATVWGRSARTTAAWAALANATTTHALDFDDTNHTLRGRPSAAVLPAILALAEQVHATGADALAAYVVALEVACKVGSLSAEVSYERGWQTSCTLGAIGAAAGGARLLGLNRTQTEHAIGLAFAQASGTRRSFGSMAKPFQIGHASQAAVLAVDLAARGLTAGPRALEGEAGYFDLYAAPVADAERLLRERLGQPYELENPGLNVKLYPCGGAAHAPIEALFDALAGRRLGVVDVQRIVVEVKYTVPLVGHHHRPTTGLEGKFSLEYCLATALLDGEVTLRQFTDAAVQRDDAQALLRQVEVVVPPDMQKGALPWPPRVGSRVTVHLRTGETLGGICVVQRGQGILTPLTDQQLEGKFLSCAEPAMGPDRARDILAMLEHVAELGDIAQLTAALGASGG
jgi:2-methylcitrate dehydratase PrpD